MEAVRRSIRSVMSIGSQEAQEPAQGSLQDCNQVWDEFLAQRVRKAISLENFEVGQSIGKGRFARVKLATLKERPELPICLKVLRKTHVVALEQAEHVINEKNVLTSINSPFVIRVMDTFQDHHFLYIAMELVVGGELFTLLRAKKKFEEKAARFFAAEVASALLHLHSMLVVFRDLKPENILVHQTGHIKLTDFGFAKYLKGEKTKTVCGTSEYMAPEIIKKEAYGLMVDWWSYGVLVYEMLVGRSPFNDADENQVLALALSGRVSYPVFLSKPSKDFIGRLLTKIPSRRLGAPEIQDTHTIEGHAFFRPIEWSKLRAGQLPPPFPPKAGEEGQYSPVEDSEPSAQEPPPPETFSAWDNYVDFSTEGQALAKSLEEQRCAKLQEKKTEDEQQQRIHGISEQTPAKVDLDVAQVKTGDRKSVV